MLIKSGAVLTLAGVAAILFSMVYDFMAKPTDMNLPGLLAAASILLVIPSGLICLVLGFLIYYLKSR